MNFILGNLPDGVTEKDIRELFLHFVKVKKVHFLAKTETKHSIYECLVEIDLEDRVVGSILAKRINHYIWRGCSIDARMLIF
jgi:RNA recognition motif-containing protein